MIAVLRAGGVEAGLMLDQMFGFTVLQLLPGRDREPSEKQTDSWGQQNAARLTSF